MNNTAFEESGNPDDELLAEYQFDYKSAKRNRFAERSEKQLLKIVVLDEDVAQVFTTPEIGQQGAESINSYDAASYKQGK